MAPEVNHPRTLALFRLVLALVVLVVALGLVGVGLSVLGVTVFLTGLSLLLTGDPNAVGFALLAGAGLVTTVGLAVVVAVAARRLDQYVTMADRRPDPLDDLTRAYVDGDVDETTFERRVERLLVGDTVTDTEAADDSFVRRALESAHARLRRRVRVTATDSDHGQEVEPELTSP